MNLEQEQIESTKGNYIKIIMTCSICGFKIRG